MIRRSLLAAGLLVALGLSACSERADTASDAPEVLNFSVLATENSTSLDTFWRPILADMEKEIGIPVKPFYGSNYTALIEALRFGQTDVGWFSNLSGLEAVRRADAEIFARTFDPSGEDGYRSVLIATAASGLTLEDVLKCDQSLDFGIGDAKSTSGTLAPMTYLFAPEGVEPERSGPPTIRPTCSPWLTACWTWPPTTPPPSACRASGTRKTAPTASPPWPTRSR